MKTCDSCRAGVADQVAVCPFCGARFEDAPPRAPVDEVEAPVTGQSPVRLAPGRRVAPPGSRVVVMGAGVDRGRRRVWPWVLALAVIGGAGAWLWSRPPPMPAVALRGVAPAGGALCAEAADCVVVYVAPWDAASTRTAALLEGLDEAWLGRRIEVVVGSGAPAQMELMARGSPLSTWVDDDGVMVAALGIETVPTWLRVQGGRITGRVEGTWLPIEAQLVRLGIE